jgi:hypothetical protein
MLLSGALTATQAGFFATVATVIPVLLLAYLLGVRQFVGRVDPGSLPGGLRFQTPLGFALALVLFAGACLALLIGVGVPADAEYKAVHALYVDHASKQDRQVCFRGTLIAGGALLVPVVTAAVRLWIRVMRAIYAKPSAKQVPGE